MVTSIYQFLLDLFEGLAFGLGQACEDAGESYAADGGINPKGDRGAETALKMGKV